MIEYFRSRRHSLAALIPPPALNRIPPPLPVDPGTVDSLYSVTMDPRRHEYILEVFADQTFVRDIVKGQTRKWDLSAAGLRLSSATDPTLERVLTCIPSIIAGVLHTIFFHRYFPPVRPSIYMPAAASSSHASSHSTQSLPIPLPSILDPPEVSTAIDSHTALLVSQLTPPSSTSSASGGSRGEIVVRFYDRKRRKTGITTGWLGRLGGGGQTEEEVCWEEWCVQVIVARPRSEAGRSSCACLVYHNPSCR